MRTMWVIATALIAVASPATAQNYHRDMYESGPGGLPPGAYSTPYDPLSNAARMNPNYIPRTYVPPTPSYRLPTAPERGRDSYRDERRDPYRLPTAPESDSDDR